jgi:hypothetical protein
LKHLKQARAEDTFLCTIQKAHEVLLLALPKPSHFHPSMVREQLHKWDLW